MYPFIQLTCLLHATMVLCELYWNTNVVQPHLLPARFHILPFGLQSTNFSSTVLWVEQRAIRLHRNITRPSPHGYQPCAQGHEGWVSAWVGVRLIFHCMSVVCCRWLDELVKMFGDCKCAFLWFQRQLKDVEVEMRRHENRNTRNTKILDQIKSGKIWNMSTVMRWANVFLLRWANVLFGALS